MLLVLALLGFAKIRTSLALRTVLAPEIGDFIGVFTHPDDVGFGVFHCLAVSRNFGPASATVCANPDLAHNLFVALREAGLETGTAAQLNRCTDFGEINFENWQEVLIAGEISVSTTNVERAAIYLDVARDFGFRDESEASPNAAGTQGNLLAGASSLHTPRAFLCALAVLPVIVALWATI